MGQNLEAVKNFVDIARRAGLNKYLKVGQSPLRFALEDARKRGYDPELIRKVDEYGLQTGQLDYVHQNNGHIQSASQLSEVLRTEPRAQYAVRLVGGDDVDLADILVVVYEGRLTRDDALKFTRDPSLRGYLGSFNRSTGISDIVESGKNLLPLDKNGVIKRIIFRRLRTLRRESLGPNPTQEEQEQFLSQLKKEMEELGEYDTN